jgi:eukaryotic-like serine/threonine-protein kinase
MHPVWAREADGVDFSFMSGEPPAIAGNADPLIGRVLNDRFRIVERIGSGGMGRVYKAIQAPLDRVVALKVLNPTYREDLDPAFLQRFFLEASVTSKLSHPNTVTLFDFGQTADHVVFIAMEYLSGRSLQQVMATEGPLPAARVLHIVAQVCRSLREAHALGIAHRDLKPANIMLMRHGDDEDFVKVLDFGLVKFFSGQAEIPKAQADLTQAGVFLGSPNYMAPEQANQEADPRSDVYSLGVVMYHMLAGRLPFHGRTHVETILLHAKAPPPKIISKDPSKPIPADVEAVVMKALEKTPEARFQSMDAMLGALKRCASFMDRSDVHTGSVPHRQSPALTNPVANPDPSPSRAGAPTRAERMIELEAIGEDSITVRRGPPPLVIALIVLLAVSAGFGVMIPVYRARHHAQVPAPSTETVSDPGKLPAPAPGKPVTSTPRSDNPSLASPRVATIHVVSDPTGARVVADDQEAGITPVDIRRELVNGDPTSVRIEIRKEGYEPFVSTENAAEGTREVAAQLKKVASRSSNRPTKHSSTKKPGGYKDNPYE